MHLFCKEHEQIMFDLSKEQIKPTILQGTEKKRSAASERPRVKRTKPIKQSTQQTQPPIQLDVKPPVELDEVHLNPVKTEQLQPEPSSIPFIKTERPEEVPLPSPSSPIPSPPASLPLPSSIPSPISSPPLPPSLPLPNLIEEESIVTNLNAIKLEPCVPNNLDLIKIEEEIKLEQPQDMEPVSLTADEIRKAEEGQAAAAMLLEQMSDVEQNPPLTPSPPPPENISEPKFSPPEYHIKREFHPEDMLTSAVQSMNTE